MANDELRASSVVGRLTCPTTFGRQLGVQFIRFGVDVKLLHGNAQTYLA